MTPPLVIDSPKAALAAPSRICRVDVMFYRTRSYLASHTQLFNFRAFLSTSSCWRGRLSASGHAPADVNAVHGLSSYLSGGHVLTDAQMMFAAEPREEPGVLFLSEAAPCSASAGACLVSPCAPGAAPPSLTDPALP